MDAKIDINVPCDLPERAPTAEKPLNNQMDKIILPIAVTQSLFFQLIFFHAPFFSCSVGRRDTNRPG